MDRPTLCISGPGNQTRLFEYLNMFGDSLFRDGERFGQFVDGGRAAGQSRHHRPPDRIGKSQEGPVQIALDSSITLQ